MATNRFQSVDAYLASQPEENQAKLELVRSAILRGVPEAEEAISYNMPTYKVRGVALLHFAGWKRHYSLYPAGAALVEAFKDELAPHMVEKATVRFSFIDPVPVRLIERIARFRAIEALNRG